MKLDCYIDSRKLMYNANSRISTLSSSSKFLACGTFEGGYLLQDISNPDTPGSVIENQLTHNTDGITNHITIDNDEKLIIASNDKALRVVDITKQKNRPIEMPFAVNCSALNRHNKNEVLLTGDCLDSFIVDLRQPVAANMSNSLSGHRDYGFSCDWNPSNEHLLMTGNQDGCIRIWDKRRSDESINCFNGSLGSDSLLGGPIRNCKFSYNGDYIGWAESLDHAGVVELQEVVNRTDYVSRVQSIDFIGKCIGLNFCPTDNAKGEQLIIGVNDCPLGGILSYTLENRCKLLDFDFYF
ncbi:uncharacterized protein PRCAT00006246001 [Priceomyces carsonii]|uniref:uncharacterized protein n=1 Tax=Priceomyces carsonii TaxID=28549 RepID=UPI002ED8FAFB|nr:unnamed protein product [Priceomyces carsonii]